MCPCVIAVDTSHQILNLRKHHRHVVRQQILSKDQQQKISASQNLSFFFRLFKRMLLWSKTFLRLNYLIDEVSNVCVLCFYLYLFLSLLRPLLQEPFNSRPKYRWASRWHHQWHGRHSKWPGAQPGGFLRCVTQAPWWPAGLWLVWRFDHSPLFSHTVLFLLLEILGVCWLEREKENSLLIY